MSRERNKLYFDLMSLLIGLALATAFTLATITTVHDCRHAAPSERISK